MEEQNKFVRGVLAMAVAGWMYTTMNTEQPKDVTPLKPKKVLSSPAPEAKSKDLPSAKPEGKPKKKKMTASSEVFRCGPNCVKNHKKCEDSGN